MHSPVGGRETRGEAFTDRGFPPNGSTMTVPPDGGLVLSNASAACTSECDTAEGDRVTLSADFTDCGLLTVFATSCADLTD